MSLLSRHWCCQKCRSTFHSFDAANPPCPKCGCVKVSWVPGGGHVGNTAGIDATVKGLASKYGMSNINSASPSRLNRAMPRVEQPPVDNARVMHFAPGFSAPVSSGGATCQVSNAAVNLRGNVRVGQALPKSATVPGPQAASRIIARHAGKVA